MKTLALCLLLLASPAAGAVPVPPDSVRDTFNRADGPLALPWNDPSVSCCSTPVTGATLSGGAVRVAGATPVNWASYPKLLQPMQYAHLTVMTPIGTLPTKTALILRGHTGGSRIEIRFGQGQVLVMTQTDGAWQAPVAAGVAAVSLGDKIAAAVDSFGTVTAFKNGVVVLTASLPTWKYVASGGVTGFSGTTGMLVDDFGYGTWASSAGSPPPPPPPPPPPVNHPPVPVISPQLASFSFSADSSTDQDGDSLSYVWDFGDSTGGSGAPIDHAYSGAGNYLVTLTATDTHGASSTTSTVIGISITGGTPPPPPPPPPPPALVVGFFFHIPSVNDSTSNCITLRPGPAQSDTVMAHWQVSPLGVEDSTYQRRGALVAKAYPVTLATSHTVTTWVSRWGRSAGTQVPGQPVQGQVPIYVRGCASSVAVMPR